jgi:Eco57I restriction-modification methylase
MSPDKQRIQLYLKAYDFTTLFREELGWDTLKEAPLAIPVDGQIYTLHPLVEKRGFKVYLCSPTTQGQIPASAVMRQIEREMTKHAYEHLIIYTDAAREEQAWQWVKREPGKPSASRLYRLHKGQSGELLSQKLLSLAFSIEEEDRLGTATVAARVRQALDTERVTKKFYDRFQKEHAAFLTFIDGIAVQSDREWYASLMLNRLMFVYFIQKKGVLATIGRGQFDGDVDYLSHKLTETRQRYGEDQFYSFYHHFLLRLFHEGLSRRERSPELEQLLGNVPYLNGGLFDVHQLEQHYPDIQIADEAFERIFAFFDDYRWHLDERPLRNDREINPDVLGYIFEKYINQKQMGAYYTKEDITGYISKNTIIPYLLEATEQKCSIAFTSDGFAWSLVRRDPDRYIYEAVKHGCDLPLPPEIEVGIHDVSQRGEWNKPAPEAYALPTEIWREVVARRTRYEEIRAKLASRAITNVNDLITYNLDICQLAQDVIAYSEGVDLLNAFYASLETITILDPTCGSGAFLFAALNILEPLYEACLDRMQEMVAERDRLEALETQRRAAYPGSYIPRFRDILAQVAKHPNRRYFILKSIIINNLYGVDIMEEAVEICKLRLFLKLVAQIDHFQDIEPLPDIDFNIRAGNTLVGFATYAEAKRAITSKLDFDNTMGRIEQKAQEVERAFHDFRAMQTAITVDPELMGEKKQQVRSQLFALNDELDRYLAGEYGKDRSKYEERFKQWRQSHQPFHWFVEFYGIMKNGGFDVIIGNPPYLELRQVNYMPHGYRSGDSGAIHAMCIERSVQLISRYGCMSMIVPLALVSTQRMKVVQEILEAHRNTWYSNYSWRPGKLFDTVNRALTIFITTPS